MTAMLNNPLSAKFDNHEAIQGAFAFDPSKCYYTADISSSADPFSSKTNKYAETGAIAIYSKAKPCHIAWSAAGATAATTEHQIIPADTLVILAVNSDMKYLRVIENAATANLWVTEL